MLKIIPNSSRVLVKQIETEQHKTASGIIMPNTSDREEKTQGKVLAVGEDFKDKYKKDEIVFYGRYAGEKLKIMEKDKETEYVLLEDEEILGWIK
ncbi:MAG TPA: co-chaperone GroES [Patescibacteria group bacterium]